MRKRCTEDSFAPNRAQNTHENAHTAINATKLFANPCELNIAKAAIVALRSTQRVATCAEAVYRSRLVLVCI